MSDDNTTRRALLKGIGIASLGGLTTTGLATAASEKAPVKKNDAKKTARRAVEHFGQTEEYSDWRASGVKSPELFYSKTRDGSSVQYVPRSWIFPIENKGEDVGYINISARQTEQPVLTFGGSQAPQRRLTEVKRNLPASSKSLSGKFIYNGGVEYMINQSPSHAVDLRSGRRKKYPGARSVEALMPASTASESESDGAPNWGSDPVSDEILNVPNWTETDDGGGSVTYIGTGRDAWDSWDGCIPVAASLALGYHEGITNADDYEREALIDRLHKKMNTTDSGSTYWSDIPPGIEDYTEGTHSYTATNQSAEKKTYTRREIGNDRPLLLNMMNGPYTGPGNGHSVCVVGQWTDSCGSLCSTFYYKVHNTYAQSPDQILHNSWERGTLTLITAN